MRQFGLAAALLAGLALSSCTGSITTKPAAETASQQIIMSMAEQKAVASLPGALPPRLTFVDETYWTGARYETGALRAWLLAHGVPLTDDRKAAQVILEPISAVDSYDEKSLFFGIPALKLSGDETPTLTLFAKNTDIAISRLSFAAYDAKTGQAIALQQSKFGVQYYHVTQALFLGVYDSPHLDPQELSR